MFSLNGKKALITGASGALGASIAKALHDQGATVMLTGTRVEALEKLGAELKDRYHILPCNLSDTASVEQLIPEAEKQMGQIDILVNNAGITRDNLMVRLKDDDLKDVVEVNLAVPFRLMRACLRGMMKQRWGRIINISSIVGVTGNPGQTNYCATKAGLIGLSKALAAEVASRNITVNCIAPGFMVSAMTGSLPEAQKEKLLSAIPMGRMGAAEDVAAAAVFLASDEAGYVTGQTLHINGGMAMI
ncbi:3-oxoacyl-[acyl-carrier-protein] reductase [Candidatus Nucleicultrix amoebiphila]|jgi:3-oxoacyl-[acyl-carrier protein] reductase|uniref:3-oxoacyl-[acyl-carrier-protein] reductase n=1 Tax=Candidatus Nucleicultrix amoebiphila FS5 TaxID=1414854 RepID=A0A1W6N615_9PROT|nr:3-oxoacyl-[acyl-carrier-protein] reductase [Candidatus Nucleicultrix amoebiphila]ARN85238.1 3-oxoacyl-ACP synthase [Candidatus Nucleicultrix amoebiphila FS5]